MKLSAMNSSRNLGKKFLIASSFAFVGFLMAVKLIYMVLICLSSIVDLTTVASMQFRAFVSLLHVLSQLFLAKFVQVADQAKIFYSFFHFTWCFYLKDSEVLAFSNK